MRVRYLTASVVVLVTTILVVGALTPNYSHARETVSRLGSAGQPFALVAQAGFVAYGVLVLIGAGVFRSRLVTALVTVYGGAAIITGLAPKDPPDGRHTLTSQIHVDATIVGGIAIVAAMAAVALCGAAAEDRRVSGVIALLTVASAITFKLTWGSSVYGLIERALLALSSGWLVVFASRSTPRSAGTSLALVSPPSRQSRASATNVDQIDTHSFHTAGG